jgi:hypothetical protein
MRKPKIPRGARRLRTYKEFESYLVSFVQGHYRFLWIVGRPGLCKSESIKAALRCLQVYYRQGGKLTPLKFYTDCFAFRGQPIVLDDPDALLGTKLGLRLIVALCDSAAVRMMSYGTTSRALGDVPPVFFTNSPVCIIANFAPSDEALRSRAIMLYFDPTNTEIHRQTAKWFWDQEIHDWFGQHLARLDPIDVRWYLDAASDKAAGRDWRQLLLKAHGIDRASIIVQDLEQDPACPSRDAKAARFVEMMGGAKGASRATYFRLRQRLAADGRLEVTGVPPIPLRRTRPPGPLTLLELDSLAAGTPLPEEAPESLDIPRREDFARPITGTGGDASRPPAGPSPFRVDDRRGWEEPEPAEDDGEGEEPPEGLG